MASLNGQTIAASYEQLLHVDADGGGNGTTHVSVKDGDNGTTFGFTIATDALMMTSTNRLEFGDNASYIHQSADGVLDLVSDTEIELNATTIDINGAVDISGLTTSAGNITVSANDPTTINAGEIAGDNDVLGINIKNTNTGDNTGGMLKFMSDNGDALTAIAHNQSANTSGEMLFFTENSGTFAERMRIDSGGTVRIGEIVDEGNAIITNGADGGRYDVLTVQEATNERWNLSFEGSGSTNSLTLNSNASSNVMHFAPDGKCGIGTGSPASLLTIKDSSGDSDGIAKGLVLLADDGDQHTSSDTAGLLTFAGRQSDGDVAISAQISSPSSSNWNDAAVNGYGQIAFSVGQGSAVNEKMRITNNAVQINGSNTSTDRTSDNAGGEIKLRNTSDTDNNYSAITFADATDSTNIARLAFLGDDHSGNKGSIEMYTANGGSLARNFRLTNDGEMILAEQGGKVGIGDSSPDYKLDVEGNDAGNYIASFWNDGDSENRYGIRIQCGHDNASDSNFAITIADGDGGEQGYVTFTNGTVTYGAFTANHDAEIPSSDNDDGYPYGTLVETENLFYAKNHDGSDLERGIRYKVKKTSSAYSKKVLGAYSSKYPTDMYENQHQIYVLGDGHIICNGEKGNIEVGDGICTSSTDGEGMKADKMAMTIGIAQEDVSFSGSESKLVAVQYGLQQFTPWESE